MVEAAPYGRVWLRHGEVGPDSGGGSGGCSTVLGPQQAIDGCPAPPGAPVPEPEADADSPLEPRTPPTSSGAHTSNSSFSSAGPRSLPLAVKTHIPFLSSPDLFSLFLLLHLYPEILTHSSDMASTVGKVCLASIVTPP